MKKFPVYFFVAILTCIMAACSDDNDVKSASGDVEKLESQLADKSWVTDIAQDLSEFKILCQYDLRSNHTALCQLMTVEETEDDVEYEIDSLEVQWNVVPNYQGYKEAGYAGPALRVVADTTETYMIIKSINEERMTCIVASNDTSVELEFDRVLEELDVSAANAKLQQMLPAWGAAPTFQGTSTVEWMKGIHDTTRVCNMSIPGTHDATTYNVSEPIAFGARCQDLNLSQQWDAGVRVFDLRIRQKNTLFYKTVSMYHDFISCNMELKSVLNTIIEKVQRHKDTDGAILICKTEGNHFANKVGSFSSVVSWLIDFVSGIGLNFDTEKLNESETVARLYKMVDEMIVQKGLLAEFKPDMTMKDLRGKILIINRNDMKPTDCYGPLASGWGANDKLTVTDASGTRTASLKVQDEYEPNKGESDDGYMARKRQAFIDMWNNSSKYAPNTWVVNQPSGYVPDLIFPDYATLAEKLYPYFIDAVSQSSGRGMIIQDYAGVDKTCRISAKATGIYAIAALALPSWFGIREKALNGVLYLAKKISPDDQVMGNRLIKAVIDNNFK